MTTLKTHENSHVKRLASSNIKSCKSFILFTFTESQGFQLTHEFSHSTDFNGIVDFMKQFITYHENKNLENTREFLNQKYSQDNSHDDKIDYLG